MFFFVVLFQIKNIGKKRCSNLSFICMIFCIFFSKWDTQPPLFVLCRFKRKIHIIAVSSISIGGGVDVTLKKNDNHAILITISLTKKYKYSSLPQVTVERVLYYIPSHQLIGFPMCKLNLLVIHDCHLAYISHWLLCSMVCYSSIFHKLFGFPRTQ